MACFAGGFLCIHNSGLPVKFSNWRALAGGWTWGDGEVFLSLPLISHGLADRCCIPSTAPYPAGLASPSGRSRPRVLTTLPSSYSLQDITSRPQHYWHFGGRIILGCPRVTSLPSCWLLGFSLHSVTNPLHQTPSVANAKLSVTGKKKISLTKSYLDSLEWLDHAYLK